MGGNCCYHLLSRRGEKENWVATKRSLVLVQLSWVGSGAVIITTTQLNSTGHSQMFRITELATTGPVELRWVADGDRRLTAPDGTQLNQLSWVELSLDLRVTSFWNYGLTQELYDLKVTWLYLRDLTWLSILWLKSWLLFFFFYEHAVYSFFELACELACQVNSLCEVRLWEVSCRALVLHVCLF